MQVRKKDSGQIFAMKVLKKQQLIEKNQVLDFFNLFAAGSHSPNQL